ncbi:uncharacterized protein LOC121050951 [Rosa chinensis]|nr:uncharacterized protein LOC121050951 [Rosa chinensis]
MAGRLKQLIGNLLKRRSKSEPLSGFSDKPKNLWTHENIEELRKTMNEEQVQKLLDLKLHVTFDPDMPLEKYELSYNPKDFELGHKEGKPKGNEEEVERKAKEGVVEQKVVRQKAKEEVLVMEQKVVKQKAKEEVVVKEQKVKEEAVVVVEQKVKDEAVVVEQKGKDEVLPDELEKKATDAAAADHR